MKSSADRLLSRIPLFSDIYIEHKIRKQYRCGKETGFYPSQLAIETSAFCNARCTMCPAHSLTRKRGFMSLEMHRLIIGKVAEWQVPIDRITHAGLGEPLLDKYLEEKISHEKSVFNGADVFIYTNGSLLSPERSRKLIAAGVDHISISLNAHRRETYEKITGLSYRRTKENISELLALKEMSAMTTAFTRGKRGRTGAEDVSLHHRSHGTTATQPSITSGFSGSLAHSWSEAV